MLSRTRTATPALGPRPAAPALATPTLVFSHSGCADPASVSPDPTVEGWTLDGLVPPSTVGAACGDSGTDAWEVSDADSTLAGPLYHRDAAGAPGVASGW